MVSEEVMVTHVPKPLRVYQILARLCDFAQVLSSEGTRMMTKFAVLAWMTGAAAIAGDLGPVPVTFYRDVLPILQRKCQTCHQPGQIAPVSFLSYESTRPWAGAIKILTATGQMPPWFAYPPYGHLLNFRALTTREVEILARWADSGAPEGNPGEAPPPVRWPENGWQGRSDIHQK